MSNNSHSYCKRDNTQGILQKQIASPLILDQICSSSLSIDHMLDKCILCSAPYSSANVPKCLPCNHTLCQRCLPEKMGPNTITCGVCQKEYQYCIESNGFLLGSDNCIKIFNDEDELINIVQQAHISIHDLINEEYSKWVASINQLLKDINNDEVQVINKDSVSKTIMVKEFTYKYPLQKRTTKLSPDSHVELRKAAAINNFELGSSDIYIDKYKRAVDTIVIESKNKNYKLDLGHDIESIQELLIAVNVYKPSLCRENKIHSKHCLGKKGANYSNYLTHHLSEDAPTGLNNKISNFVPCTDSIECKSKEHSKKSLFKQDTTKIIQSPLEQVILGTNIKLRENDKLFTPNNIVDGHYPHIASGNVKFDIHSMYRVCYNCFTTKNDKPYNYEDIVYLSNNEIRKYQSTHFCPSQMIGLCLKHALKYKIKYPGLNIYSIESKSTMNKQYAQNSKKISELMLCHMKSQYALTYDRLKIPLDRYLPHKY